MIYLWNYLPRRLSLSHPSRLSWPTIHWNRTNGLVSDDRIQIYKIHFILLSISVASDCDFITQYWDTLLLSVSLLYISILYSVRFLKSSLYFDDIDHMYISDMLIHRLHISGSHASTINIHYSQRRIRQCFISNCRGSNASSFLI